MNTCVYALSFQHSADSTLKLAYLGGLPTLKPNCTILHRFPSIDPSCHPVRHPWPHSATGDLWWGRRFKWFSYSFSCPVFPVSWLLMATLERGIMEIPKTICSLDLQTPTFCRSYKRAMNDWFVCLSTYSNVKTRARKYQLLEDYGIL